MKKEKYNVIKRVMNNSIVFESEKPKLKTTLAKMAIKEKLLYGGVPYIFLNTENKKSINLIL